MPLVRDEIVAGGVRLCLWQITEEVDALPVPAAYDATAMRSPSRRRETLAVYAMLHYMTGRNDLVIRHDEAGRPLLEGWQISVSHTKGWAALLMAGQGRVAVDIEFVSDRVSKVASRFIRPDEMQDGLFCQLVNWSAKETVYKYCSEENLQYFEMRLKPYRQEKSGSLEVENMKTGQHILVDYELTPDYVLTYAVGR